MSAPVLNLLGIALRGGNLVVGEEPVEAVARARDARLLLLASDAADNTARRVRHFADAGQCIWVRIPFTKAELGQTLGRSAVAICALTDIGLAAAVAHKLADLDPVRFDETAGRLDIKAQRAAERRAEQQRHEKNVRTGKYRKQPKDEAPAKEQGAVTPVRSVRRDENKRKPDDRRDSRPAPRKDGEKRPFKDQRSKKPGANRFAHSLPVKKGKGSVKKSGRSFQ